MGNINEYSCVNAKIRARLKDRLSKDMLIQLSDKHTVEELMQSLKDTRFSPCVEIYEKTGDVEKFEQILFDQEVSLYSKLLPYVSTRVKPFLRVLGEKYEVENIKNAVRLWYSRAILNRSLAQRATYLYQGKIIHDINWLEIINAEKFDEEVVPTLKNTPYGVVAQEYIGGKIDNSLFYFESAMDRMYFKRLFDSHRNLNTQDAKIVETVLLQDINLKNLLNVIRYGWYYKMEDKVLRSLLIPHGRVYNSSELANFLHTNAEERSITEIVITFLPELKEKLGKVASNFDLTNTLEHSHQRVKLRRIAEQQVLIIEQELHRKRNNLYHKLMLGDPFSIGALISYLFSYREEDRFIVSLIQRVYYNKREVSE